MMPSRPKQKLLVVLIVGLALNLILVFGAGWRFYQRLSSLYDDLKEKRRELAGLEEKERRLKDLERALGDLKSGIASIESTFFKSGEVVQFLQTLEAAAHRSDVQLAVESADVADPKASVKESSFVITVTGGFLEIYAFLGRVSQAPYHIDFSSLDIAASDGAHTQAHVALSVLSQ